MPSLSPAAPSGTGLPRPSLGRRHNSHTLVSPLTNDQPLRHTVSRPNRHAKVVLPRNASSGRNLAKLARQQQQQQQQQINTDDVRRHARQRSHEGDTEIRLPGSLDETSPVVPPPMRRNMTAYQLPRANSHVKLKKNLSHGALTRLSSTKNMATLQSVTHKAPPSPGMKARSKRPKSVDMELDLREQEEEVLRQRASAGTTKKVGFNVGSSGDSDGENVEGNDVQEDEWTEESASASPYSTRQNTAENSRRTSMAVTEHPPPRLSTESRPLVLVSIPPQSDHQERAKEQSPKPEEEASTTDKESTTEEASEDSVSSHSSAFVKQELPAAPPQQPLPNHVQRSPLAAAKDYPSDATRRILNRSLQLPAPALLSNVSAMDNFHSSSPSQFLHGDEAGGSQEEEELVSRFVPSASHPSIGNGSGGNTAATNTPMPGSYQNPEEELALRKGNPFHTGLQTPTSPGSTRSGSSGVVTPAMQRSRTELRMLADKALADREEAAERGASVPFHVFDRRNDFMKARRYGRDGGYGEWSKSSKLGPEFFQGRFNAVNQELRVVETFRDPYAESIQRLRQCKASALNQARGSLHKPPAHVLKVSKSAVTLPRQASKLSTSTSPPTEAAKLAQSESPHKASPLASAKSSVQIFIAASEPAHPAQPRRGVSFAGAPPQERSSRMAKQGEEESGPEAIARALWESLLG